NYAPWTNGARNPVSAAHLQDENKFFADLRNESLPSVVFIKPLGPNNEHPGYASLLEGQQHVADIVNAVKKSDYWEKSLIIVTYDEHGGRWDHVTPPASQWRLGRRFPRSDNRDRSLRQEQLCRSCAARYAVDFKDDRRAVRACAAECLRCAGIIAQEQPEPRGRVPYCLGLP